MHNVEKHAHRMQYKQYNTRAALTNAPFNQRTRAYESNESISQDQQGQMHELVKINKGKCIN
jgi:hypothetical protein